LEDLGGFETNILDFPGQPENGFFPKQKKRYIYIYIFVVCPPPQQKQQTTNRCFFLLGKLFLGPGCQNLDSDSFSLFFGMFLSEGYTFQQNINRCVKDTLWDISKNDNIQISTNKSNSAPLP
jgi:hypothetical protein